MKLKTHLNITLAALGLALSFGVSATDVTTGQFVLNFNEAALLDFPTETVHSAWFNETGSANKTLTDILKAAPQNNISDSFTFNVFGSTIATPPLGLEDRNPIASTFSYTNSDPTTGRGKIGLAGVHQIRGNFEGKIISGDYDLSYDVNRIGNAAKGSGWFLTNHISFTLPAYDLTNVSMKIIDDSNFSLSGDVVFTESNAKMMLTKAGVKAGTFTFTTVSSPLSATYSSGTNLLTLPSVNVNDIGYKTTLKSTLIDNRIAFYLKTLEPAPITSNTAYYSISTGIFKIPSVKLVDERGNMTGSVENPELILIPDSTPLHFFVN